MDRPQKSRTIIIISLFTAAISMICMLGWAFHLAFIQHIPMLAVLKFNSALCFFLFSSALLLFQYKPSPYNTLSFFILSLCGTAIGLITLFQFIFHFNTGIDQLFVSDPATPAYLNPFPGRMAFNSAVNFSLLGLGILGLTANKHVLNIISQYIFHLVTVIAVIVLIGISGRWDASTGTIGRGRLSTLDDRLRVKNRSLVRAELILDDLHGRTSLVLLRLAGIND